MSDTEKTILLYLEKKEKIENHRELLSVVKVEEEKLIGYLKSLESDKYVVLTTKSEQKVGPSEEGKQILTKGKSLEVEVFETLKTEGTPLSELETKFGKEPVKIFTGQAMKNKWITQKKGDTGLVLLKNVDSIKDETLELLKKVELGENLDKNTTEGLKKRKLVGMITIKTFEISKGENFATERKKPESDLTSEMLLSGEWKNLKFKDYNFQAKGKKVDSGYFHPLLKVRTAFREIFLEMGFEEMQTNKYVESSFWNFDALFQPQQHPARDAHDTFFMENPKVTTDFPKEYLEKVKEVHEKGGYGSIGYRYDWKVEEAQKNILRTHTTAVSTRYLYEYAQNYKKDKVIVPKKYFSIDRVFRNEATDQTHLCEFHQIEGMVVGKDLSLGDLIGTLNTFFAKIGIKKLKFKPAYNPYTEPSLEIYGYHEELKRWVEIGNSGMFRPEMLLPMGLPEDLVVIAWGLSLERPTMINYGYKDIRDLVGDTVPFEKIHNNAICIFDH